MDEKKPIYQDQASLLRPTHLIATIALIAYVYGELAAHVYPFVLLPTLGIPVRVVALTLFSVIHAGARFGWRVGLLMFFATALITWSFEQAGVATGAIYGVYHYSGMLGPKLGAVPLLIPLAWFMMMYPSYLVATLIVDGRILPERTDLARLLTRALVAAMVMTAWDAVIDPGMSKAGYWVWEHGGPYFGVPRQNFVGWLITTFVVYTTFGLIQRRLRPDIHQTRDGFALLPIIAYVSVTFTQVANQESGPSSVIALFAMGFPVLISLVRWSQDLASLKPRRQQIRVQPETVSAGR
jgi:putative membrane protein